MRDDGNLIPWLEEQEATLRGLKAEIRPVAGWHEVFTRRLEQDLDAGRLRGNVPRCLALFVLQAVGSQLEARLLELTRARGESLRKSVYPSARRDRSEQSGEFVARAGRAFDTRRQGLSEYCFTALVIGRYLEFRWGFKPTARELAALFRAGLAATGRPAHLQVVDHDRLRRNLKNYEAKHPHVLATGERCAEIIEGSYSSR